MAGKRIDPKLELDGEFENLVLSLGENTASLNAHQVDKLLEKLGGLRGLMKPEVEHTLVSNQVSAIDNPTWLTQPVPVTGDAIFHIRDPRFGWLSYFLPRQVAAKLGGLLTNQSNAPLFTGPPSKQ